LEFPGICQVFKYFHQVFVTTLVASLFWPTQHHYEQLIYCNIWSLHFFN